MKIVKIIIALWFLFLHEMGTEVVAQEKTSLPRVEIFAGAELHYRDLFYTKMYEVLLNLTPGVKWHIGRHWQLAGQAIIPVYNDYGNRYKKVRLNMAVLSKEWN